MFKKTHSEAFKAKIKSLLSKKGKWQKSPQELIRRYPKQILTGMLLTILCSVIANLICIKKNNNKQPIPNLSLTDLKINFNTGKILKTVYALNEVADIKREFENLQKKDHLDNRDSIRYRTTLDRIKILKNSINQPYKIIP